MSEEVKKDPIKISIDTNALLGSHEEEETKGDDKETVTTFAFGDYTVQLYGGDKKRNPYDLMEKLYEIGKDETMTPDEKNRDLKAIIKEYME